MHYAEAFSRPFKDLKKLTIGAILNGIPLLNILTGLFVTGYIAECARLTLHRKNQLPEWTDLWGLFKKGFFITLIWMLYSIPFFLTFFILLFRSIQTFLQETDPDAFVQHILQQQGPYLLLLIVLFLLTWYVTLGAVFRYVEKYRFKEAFQIQALVGQTFTSTYFKAWIIAFIFTVLIGILLQSVFAVLKSDSIFLGLVYNLFSGYLGFIATLITASLVGEAWREIKSR